MPWDKSYWIKGREMLCGGKKRAKDLKRFQCLGTLPAASNLVKVNFLVNISVQLKG